MLQRSSKTGLTAAAHYIVKSNVTHRDHHLSPCLFRRTVNCSDCDVALCLILCNFSFFTRLLPLSVIVDAGGSSQASGGVSEIA